MIPVILKRTALAVYAVSSCFISKAQISETHFPDRTRNIVWHTPCGAAQINGLAIGIQAVRFGKGTLTIKGLNADVGLFAASFTPIFIISNTLSKEKREKFAPVHPDSASTIIHGLSISYGGELDVELHGVNLAGGVTLATKLYGVSLTGVYTKCYEFRGLSIAGLNNYSVKGKGIQVGLFNHCTNLKGLQIGLWNKSGKRGLPFINWGI